MKINPCQTRFEFLSQFRKLRNAFECFVTQVHTHLPKTKRVWPMKINVICTVRLNMDKSGILGSNKGKYGQIRAIKGKYAQIRVIKPKYSQI